MIEVSVSSVTSKGQVTIPKEIRDTLGIGEGDKVIFLVDGDAAVIRKVRDEKLSDILGRQIPWPESSLEFQRRLRGEWQRP
ncbi:AbrB/MazE/SpoVT family DNA-binding domain-containing protein [Candidatus Bathyarchaeota archaeon]|nr:AbrB/MazE/SpoVT family DNA-binding domain-containing protein [Candidatus Bathyarchaeota archaeon]